MSVCAERTLSRRPLPAPVVSSRERQVEGLAQELRGRLLAGAGARGGALQRGAVRVLEPMSRHTTFRIGGPADLFVNPMDSDDLAVVMQFARAKGLPSKVIGNGSNLLVGDGGIRGMVVRLAPHFREVRWLDSGVEVGAGATLARLVKESAEVGLSGLESTVGIPGTIGGALATNAGTDTGSIGELVVGATVLNGDCEVCQWSAAQFAYRYRHSSLISPPRHGEASLARPGGHPPPADTRPTHRRERAREAAPYSSLGSGAADHALRTTTATVVTAVLKLEPAAREEIEAKRERLLAKRAARQPLRAWSAGSVFKNPWGVAAGKVLDRAGAKGMRVGDAEVARTHANFFINRGRATAADMRELIARAHALALRRYGIDLELEIELVGA